MPIVKIDGLDTYYEIHGEGETLVLLHNGFSCGMMWEEIHPMLVAAGFQVLLYDRRGFGRSEGGADFAGYYVDENFRDHSVSAMAELLALLGIDRFHIVGQCEGGVLGDRIGECFRPEWWACVLVKVAFSDAPWCGPNPLTPPPHWTRTDSWDDLARRVRVTHE